MRYFTDYEATQLVSVVAEVFLHGLQVHTKQLDVHGTFLVLTMDVALIRNLLV